MTKLKIASATLGLAMVFGIAAPAQAQTVADLQAQIQLLMQQLAALQTGGTTASAGVAFTQNLTVGSTGAEVVALQQMLVAQGHLAMPAGVAYGYFGSLTQAAVARWQAANGVAPASGYWGPISRARAATLGMTGGTTTGGTTTTGGSTSTGDLTGGAGDITVTNRSSGTENEVLEGEDDVKVLGFEVEADGSDVRVSNIKVQLTHTGAGSDRLDRYVDEVCVFMDNSSLGCADADDFSESSDVYTQNISVNGVVREDDSERFYLAVSAINNIDSNDLSENWSITLDNVRFQDAMGAIITEDTNISETFTFEDLASAGNIELNVNEDDEDVNEAQTIQVNDTGDTNDVEILSFTIEAEGSDLALEIMEFAIVSSGAGVTEIANDFRLMMGNTEVGTVTIDRDDDNGSDGFASSSDTTVWVRVTDLDDDDVMIDEGDEEAFTLVADLNDVEGGFATGDSFTSVTLDSADITAEDENGDTVTDLNGTADSGPLTFSSTGIMADLTSSSASAVLNLDSTSSDDQGQYVMDFTVTAFEDTAFVELTAASSTGAAASDVGAAFIIENASTGAAVGTGTSTATLARVSGGTETGGFVRINAGQTATFRLTVYYDAAASGIYRVQMDSVGYAATAVDATAEYDTVPASDFESTSIQVLN